LSESPWIVHITMDLVAVLKEPAKVLINPT